MQATAQMCADGQQTLMTKVLDYVASLEGHAKVLLFLHHNKLDETPLKLRVPFDKDEEGGVNQLSKIFVSESSWSILLRYDDAVPIQSAHSHRDKGYLLLTGAFAPQVLATDTATGTCIAAVIEKTAGVPLDRLSDTSAAFKIRMAERDEAPANKRADRLIGGILPEWQSLLWYCSAHKGHTVAEKLMQLPIAKESLSGVVQALLSIQPAQHLHRLQMAIEKVVADNLVIVPLTPLSPEAMSARQQLLRLFCPDSATPRKKSAVLLLSCLLNGDWRSSQIQHRCAGTGCCSDRADSLRKVVLALQMLLRTQKPSSLCRDNWLQWRRPVQLIAILCWIHSLLPRAFPIAFPQQKTQEQ